MDITEQEHYQRIRRVLIGILVLNWAVAIAKIIYGSASRCSSMTADGFHSLSDGASNIVGLVGIHFACQPKDSDHPYGHKKYETFFSLLIAFLLFMLCFNLLREGLLRLRHSVTPQINTGSFLVMLITLGINLWVMRYEHKKGLDLKSDILVSDALHTKADIFTSISVIITLIVIKLGYPIIDPIATMVIALFIAHAGYSIIKQSSAVLCDTAIMDDKKISRIVLGVKGVRACHKIRSRGRPDDIHIDLHVQVNADMHVDTAHAVSYAIEEAIKDKIPSVTDVVVHIEPKEKAGATPGSP
ncbi:MAG: cation diffusion facilitator family transporter [Candidatus Omnitrophota bacterium]|nr:cation diffusion facilitator family transporter [Candidatus Omnitrophota bacterium]